MDSEIYEELPLCFFSNQKTPTHPLRLFLILSSQINKKKIKNENEKENCFPDIVSSRKTKIQGDTNVPSSRPFNFFPLLHTTASYSLDKTYIFQALRALLKEKGENKRTQHKLIFRFCRTIYNKGSTTRHITLQEHNEQVT